MKEENNVFTVISITVYISLSLWIKLVITAMIWVKCLYNRNFLFLCDKNVMISKN